MVKVGSITIDKKQDKLSSGRSLVVGEMRYPDDMDKNKSGIHIRKKEQVKIPEK